MRSLLEYAIRKDGLAQMSTVQSQPPGVNPHVEAVRPHSLKPTRRDVQDAARLTAEAKGALSRIQKTSGNWRTGVAGLTTLVTATLLFKGRDSITGYATWVQVFLGISVVVSLVLSVVSLWLLLSAAYGRVASTPVSSQSVLDAGGVDVRNWGRAQVALQDLKRGRRAAVWAALALAVALLVSWYGPPAEKNSSELVQLTVEGSGADSVICGQLEGANSTEFRVLVAGQPDVRSVRTADLVGLKVVASC